MHVYYVYLNVSLRESTSICLYICIYRYACTHANLPVNTYACARAHTRAHIYIVASTHTQAQSSTHAQKHTCLHAACTYAHQQARARTQHTFVQKACSMHLNACLYITTYKHTPVATPTRTHFDIHRLSVTHTHTNTP